MASIAIDPHMAIIHVHVGQNLMDDVLLDIGSRANIITKDLRKQLGLPPPSPPIMCFEWRIKVWWS
jgi:hypothetical protein